MATLHIREAVPADGELIVSLSRQTFLETFAAQNTRENMDKFMNDVFSPEALAKEVGLPGNIFLLAYIGEEPVGYVRMRDTNQPAALQERSSIEIARIYAVAAGIGKGIGRALMEKCIALAREIHKKVIWLGVWEHNQRAIDFYYKWGFEKFGEHTFMLGDDPQTDWLMKKQL